MTRKSKKILTKAELDAARGHFCLLSDGSKGYICVKTHSDFKPTRVLHNSTDSSGWEYTDIERNQDDAPDSIKKTFSRAYNANDEGDAFALKVVKVLEKYDGRKYRKKKDKKTSKAFLTASEIEAGVGHFCKLSDGQDAFIARGKNGRATICLHKQFNNGLGWYLDKSDLADGFKSYAEEYEYGWYIHDESDAFEIKIVSILKEEQSEKTILDMTVKEILEKLNAFIKC